MWMKSVLVIFFYHGLNEIKAKSFPVFSLDYPSFIQSRPHSFIVSRLSIEITLLPLLSI